MEVRVTLAGGTPTPPPSRPVQKTYFILNEDAQTVKIGRALDPEHRLKTLQTGSVAPIKLLAVLPYDAEKELHRKFKQLLVRGEWYRYSDSLREFIGDLK